MKDGSYQSVSIFIIHIFLIFGWTHPYRVRKCIPHAILRKEIGFLEEQNLPWDFFPFLDQTCLASLRSADNSLIAESEKLSLGKFCSSSNPFLTMIAWRNIYSSPSREDTPTRPSIMEVNFQPNESITKPDLPPSYDEVMNSK